MYEWTYQRIKDLLETSYAGEWGSPPSPGNARILRATDIDFDGRIKGHGALRQVAPAVVKKKQLQSGDIMLEASGGSSEKPVGRVAFFYGENSPFPFLTSNFYKTLRPEKNVDARFLHWSLLRFYRQPDILQFQQQTTGIINLKFQDYLNAIIYTPLALNEQKLIACILDTIDSQVQKSEALITKLEKVKQGLLQDLLTRGIGENGRLRPSPEQAPELYKVSPLGLIPREWKVQPLGDLSEIISGVTLGGKSGSSAWPLVPYLRVANVQDGYLDLSDLKLIRVSPSNIERYRLLPGDVLMNEGGDFDKLGRGTLWQGQVDLCLHQNHVFRVRTTPTLLSPHFLTAFSSSAIGKRYFIQSSKQSTNLASINSTQLKAFQVPLPSSEEQNLIVKKLQAMASKIDSEKEFLDKIIIQKSGLMDDLLTGRIRVTQLLEKAQATTPA